MTRTGIVTAVLPLCVAATLSADVTIRSQTTGKGLGMSTNAPSTTYVKGLKMRIDTVTGGTTRSVIYDVDGQKMYLFDSKKKEADVWDMAAVAVEVNKAVDTSAMTASITPNGQTRTIAGQTAEGYDITVTVPAGAEAPIKLTMNLAGKTWMVRDAPGSADYAAFYLAASERGWIFSDPRAAKGSPGQARAMAEMYEQFARAGGLPYASDMEIRPTGEGPVAGLMARMGNITATSTTESVDTATLDPALFAPPAGYKLNARK